MSIALCLSGCASNRALLGNAMAGKAGATIAAEAIEEGREVPDIPADCRRTEAGGVSLGDRLDVALVKTDRALGRANARVLRCAAWHDDYRKGRKG
ncbi:hypothetical protein [Mesorhizobium sp. L-8-10]|uniref:hypothetical protein n=1 Tax=Mesorhizobium sp. L-8-10 TaxID=2744523 RepID=UPI001926E73C|nr:hypothetical protein [Mesorhizobium sp. L-8-10]